MTVTHKIDLLDAGPYSSWFGRRLGTIVAPGNEAIASALTWCDHQLGCGHTCLDFDLPVIAPLRGSEARGAEGRAKLPAMWLAELLKCEQVLSLPRGSMQESDRPLVVEGRRLFLAANHSDEIAIARSLVARATAPSQWPQAGGATGALSGCSDAAQDQAVALIGGRALALVIGSPGTGKTTVASRMVDAVLSAKRDARITLVAPTGKASARLGEAMRAAASNPAFSEATRAALVGLSAETLDLALLRRRGEDLGSADLVILDECSMVGNTLMRRMLDRVRADASLVLLGDAHQLASVAGGTLLSDIMPTGEEHPLSRCTVRLATSHRFPAEGAVARLAEAVNTGDFEGAKALLADAPANAQVRWHRVSTPAEVVAVALQCRQRMGEDARMLCGHRVGWDGSLAINRAFVRSLGVARDPDPVGGEDFPGRKIIVTVNDRTNSLVNGDTGEIAVIDGRMVARFPDRAEPVEVAQLPAHEAAYALTIHKAQGSEYERVIVALPAEPSPVITRELLYTAITRTRGRVEIIATEAALKAAVEAQVHRASGLKERMTASIT